MTNTNNNQTLEQKLSGVQKSLDNYTGLGVITCLNAISGAGLVEGLGLYFTSKSNLEMISNPYVAAVIAPALLFGPTLLSGITACLAEYKIKKLESKCKELYGSIKSEVKYHGK